MGGNPGPQVYWGYGLAFLLGIQGTQLDLLGYGWRGPYVLGALPGLLTSLLILATMAEPPREAGPPATEGPRGCGQLRKVADPALLLLLLGAMAR